MSSLSDRDMNPAYSADEGRSPFKSDAAPAEEAISSQIPNAETELGMSGKPDPTADPGLAKLRQEFFILNDLDDPLEQHYRLIQYARASDLPLEEYQRLFERFKSDRQTQDPEKNLLTTLHAEFRELARIKDPIARNYRLIHQARASDVPTDEYRELFEEYERRSAEGIDGIISNSFHGLASLARFLGQFTIIVGLILFIAEADSRKRESHTQAWQIITGAKGFTESAGRIQAIQTLKQGCSYRDRQVSDMPREASQTIDWLDPRDWSQINWREVPIVGGFFPDCINLRGLDAENAHLPYIDLSWAELNNARLQNSGLWSANLQGTRLQGAQLQRARLRNANLLGTNLAGAQLQNADLSGTKLGCLPQDSLEFCTDLTQANLTGANLRGDRREQTILYTILGSAIALDNAEFAHALYDDGTKMGLCEAANVQEGTCGEGSLLSVGEFLDIEQVDPTAYHCLASPNGECPDLSRFQRYLDDALRRAYEIGPGVNLNGAVLRLAELGQANLKGASLTEADLRGVRLDNAQLAQAQMQNADLSCTELRADQSTASSNCASLKEADLRGANLTTANLNRANLSNANLSCYVPPTEAADPSQSSDRSEGSPAGSPDCTVLRNANVRATVLTDANLSGADLQGADLTDAALLGADLSGANLSGATGWTPQQIKAAVNWQDATYDEAQRRSLGL